MNALAHSSWPNRHAPALGLGVSLLVHALAVAWLLHAWLPARLAEKAPVPAMPIEVRLAPPRVPAPVMAVAAPEASGAARASTTPRAAPLSPERSPSRSQARSAAAAPAVIRSRAAQDDDAAAPARASADDTPAAAAPSVAGPADASPSADTNAAPAVDMAAARSAARLIGREGGKGLVALPARKPTVDPNGGRQTVDPIEAARRKDCTSAYSSLGLLALIPLAKDAVTGTGCKW